MGMLPAYSMSDFTDFKDFSPIEVNPNVNPLIEGNTLLATTVFKWTKEADKLHKNQKETFVEIINKLARIIFKRIEALDESGCSEDVIRLHIQRSIVELDRAAQIFYQTRTKYIEGQKSSEVKNKEIQQDINSLQPQTAIDIKSLSPEDSNLYIHILNEIIKID